MKVTNETMALAHEILAYWLRFNNHNQDAWVGTPSLGTPLIKVVESENGGRDANVCNTTMCAAGTAVFLGKPTETFIQMSRRPWDSEGWKEMGGKLLGLDDEEAESVFLSDDKSAKRYMRAIAAGSQKKFDRATEKRKELD